jgi:hypothetical protein
MKNFGSPWSSPDNEAKSERLMGTINCMRLIEFGWDKDFGFLVPELVSNGSKY